jgi:OHCU decarboxylase
MSDKLTTKISVAVLDSMHEASAAVLFEDCCGARVWVRRMVDGRPYGTYAKVLAHADTIWPTLGRDDWLQAFGSHPRIGQRRISGQSESSARMSEKEQSAATVADATTKSELTKLNAEYEHRFGHTFIICASGLTAEQILDRLRTRLSGAPDAELRIAAEEQRKITQLRLERMLEDA